MKFDIWVFFENLSRKLELHSNLRRMTGTSHVDRYTLMIISRSYLLRMRNVSDIFFYFALWPTNAQFQKLSHTYMFRHYRVILREIVINTLPSYTSISNAGLGNTMYNKGISHRFYATFIKPKWNIFIVNCITNSCIWNTWVSWQGIDYKLPEDDRILSKHVGVW